MGAVPVRTWLLFPSHLGRKYCRTSPLTLPPAKEPFPRLAPLLGTMPYKQRVLFMTRSPVPSSEGGICCSGVSLAPQMSILGIL